MKKLDNVDMRNFLLFLTAICFSMNTKATDKSGIGSTPFHEVTIDQEGEYYVDIDFDGIEEKVCVGEYSNVEVFKNDGSSFNAKDVSIEIPYCLLRIHRCCPAHQAYTTINYLQKTIFTEAHYGSSDYEIHQYKKIGNNWIEVLPITPLSILQRSLYPFQPRGWVYYRSHPVWKW